MLFNKKALAEILLSEFPILKTKLNSKEIINCILSEIAKAIIKGEVVNIPEIGKFYVKQYKLKNARNPKTGEKIPVRNINRVKFIVSKTIKSKIN
jgi:nucleoid DNA-binding protein